MSATAIPITHWHQALLARNCRWQCWATLDGIAAPVAVLAVRQVGDDGVEVLTDYGYKRAIAIWTYQRPQLEQQPIEQSLFG